MKVGRIAVAVAGLVHQRRFARVPVCDLDAWLCDPAHYNYQDVEIDFHMATEREASRGIREVAFVVYTETFADKGDWRATATQPTRKEGA